MFTVKDNVLTIGFKNVALKTEADINYYLTIKDIKSITTNGEINIVIQEGLKSRKEERKHGQKTKKKPLSPI